MGRSPCCDKTGLKKGPWTQEEDIKLTQYIRIHGPGNWRTLPKNAGLQRCGKSCRLRWTNYLRPEIKRGRFSFEEEETIIQLHSVLGNKWSAIAARLPGRTDNEIKNYWNTQIRKKLLQKGIDPVTHAPRLDFSELSTILTSAQFNLSNLLSLQTLVHPDVLRLVSLLAASSSNQEHQEMLLTNHINTMNQSPIQQTQNCYSMHLSPPSSQVLDKANLIHENNGLYFSNHLVNFSDQTSQENVVPPFSIDNSVTLPSPQFTAQASENWSFLRPDIENKIPSSQNFNFDSILSIPMSSPSHVNSSLDLKSREEVTAAHDSVRASRKLGCMVNW